MWDGLDSEKLRLNFPNKFWQQLILKIIEDDIKEDHFWDYKQNFSFSYPKANRKKIVQEILKDVTAFANANSGLIIYGIRDELPRKLVKIDNVELGIDHTLQIIENNYPHHFGIFGFPVKVKYQSESFNCVIFLISKSKELIPVKDYKTGKFIYYIREGSSSKPIIDKNKLFDLNEKKKKVKSFQFPVLGYIRNLLNLPHQFLISDALERQYQNSDPIENNDYILANFIPIIIPSKIYSADLNENWTGNVSELIYQPFIVKENRIINFYSFTSNNILNEFVDNDTQEKILTKRIIRDRRNKYYLVELLNQWIDTILKYKGLYRCERTRAYYFVNSESQQLTWSLHNSKIKIRRTTRYVVRFFYKEESNELNYVKNEAANIFTRFIGNVPYIIISRRLLFTKDGYDPVSGKVTKKLVSSFLKDPKKDYNLNQRNNFLFWYYFLTYRARTMTLDDNSIVRDLESNQKKIIRLYNIIKIKNPLLFRTSWFPNSEYSIEGTLESYFGRYQF